MKKLFLCHARKDAAEVAELAEELRLRGIVPWVDQQGGFLLGDITPETARRAIREDCFGILFYATAEAFNSTFILKVELNEAIKTREQNPNFMLVAIPRHMSFADLSRLSVERLGTDLGLFNSHIIIDQNNNNEPIPLRTQLAEIAKLVLARHVFGLNAAEVEPNLSIQVSSRQRLPDMARDVLCIDATRNGGVFPTFVEPATWLRYTIALRDVKTHIAEKFAHPRLYLHGSRHLTASFILGRTFSAASGFRLDIQQGMSCWVTDYPVDSTLFLDVTEDDGSVSSSSLFVEITTTEKTVRDSVRRFIQKTHSQPFRYIRFQPMSGPRLGAVTNNAVCLSMARQVRVELARAISEYSISEIHIFSAIPQALAMMIGYHLNAQRPIQLYEYDGTDYHPSYRLEG